MTDERTSLCEVLDIVAHILYTIALFTCRASGLVFYRRITPRYGKLHLAIKLSVVFLFVCSLPQLFLIIFHCIPVTGLWPFSWQADQSQYRCLQWHLVYAINSGLSLAYDIVMFAIPATLIKSLRVGWKKRLKISLVLFPGVL